MDRTDTPFHLAVDHFVWGTVRAHELPAVASAAIDQGFFSTSLSEVALTERPIESEVVPLFEKALDELGVDRPDKVTAGRRIARDYARRMVEGELSVHEGARWIWLNIATHPDWPNDPSVDAFVYGASEWDEVEGTAQQREIERDVLGAARELLRQIPGRAPRRQSSDSADFELHGGASRMTGCQVKSSDPGTNSRAVIVQRRFPPTTLSFRPLFCSGSSEAPRRFSIEPGDPSGFRVVGSACGRRNQRFDVYLYHRRESDGGSVSTSTEGYIVPAETGSYVYVRAALPAWWWAFDAIMPVVVFVNVGWTLKGVAIAIGMLFVLLGIRSGLITAEASQTVAVLRKVLAPRSRAWSADHAEDDLPLALLAKCTSRGPAQKSLLRHPSVPLCLSR